MEISLVIDNILQYSPSNMLTTLGMLSHEWAKIAAKEHFVRGKITRTEERFRCCFLHYSQAIALDPQFANAYLQRAFLKADCLFEKDIPKNDYDKALENWKTLEGGLADKALIESAVLEDKHKLDEALQVIEHSLQEHDPCWPLTLRTRARLRYIHHGDIQGAIHDMLQVVQELKQRPKSIVFDDAFLSRALSEVGWLQLQNSEMDQAAKSLSESLDIFPRCAFALRRKAKLLEVRNDIDGALDCYRQVLELNPDNAEVLADRSVLLMDQGRINEAELDAKHAVEAQPRLTYAHRWYATLKMEMNIEVEALEILENGLKILDDDKVMYAMCGEIHAKLNNIEQSKECFRKAKEINENDEESERQEYRLFLSNVDCAVNRALSSSSEAKNEFENSIAYLNRVLEIEPDNTQVLCDKARIHLRMGNPEAALESSERALAVDPLNASGYTMHAIILVFQGFMHEALNHLSEGIEYLESHKDTQDKPKPKRSVSPALYYWHGQINIMLGQTEEAKSDFSKAVSLDPLLLDDSARKANKQLPML